jgi:hypothetical protein
MATRFAASSLVVLLGFIPACDRGPASHEIAGPTFSLAVEPLVTGGALVLNSGDGKPDISCFFGLFTTTHGTAVRSPNGNATLSCQFEGLPLIAASERLDGWECTINHGGTSVTFQSLWVRSPAGRAQVTCEFSGKPEFSAVVSFAGTVHPALEGFFTRPLSDFPGGLVTGEVVAVGLACGPIATNLSGRIALIERGTCTYVVKHLNALAAGATAAIVYNSMAGGETLIEMGGSPVALPGVFVARSTGLSLSALPPITATITSCRNSATCRGAF